MLGSFYADDVNIVGENIETIQKNKCFAIALMMEVVRTSETSVYYNETTRRNMPEGSNLLILLWITILLVMGSLPLNAVVVLLMEIVNPYFDVFSTNLSIDLCDEVSVSFLAY
jgi:hypothetical protein